MSFQDIEAGVARPGYSNSILSQPNEDSAFLSAQSTLSLQVFKINSNVQGILKLVDQLGTVKDSATLRKSLHDLTDTTRDMAKRSSEDLKKLALMATSSSRHKTSLQKTSHDLQLSLVAFQKAQQVSAERQRTVVEGVKIAVEEEHEHRGDSTLRDPSASPQQRQAQLLHSQLSPHELVYQESLIQEREAEIGEIESGIHELAEIFRDLGTLVNQQGGMIDNIESNVFSIAADTQGAAEELSTASEYQRKAGRRAACLMVILVIVVAVVLLAILS
ncbi:t-SNARE [Rhizopogon vinicolor AM-OR11-026]|uniref:t-SNARE n=1 Tax=Rhizopogon vinicolor AM-OR11-026 TaxID=1314800 RepID=A0A1B7MIP9_9AGAM|nr:t-SNARE [Rhizopogon vinicolor AM-OR11-026]